MYICLEIDRTVLQLKRKLLKIFQKTNGKSNIVLMISNRMCVYALRINLNDRIVKHIYLFAFDLSIESLNKQKKH